MANLGRISGQLLKDNLTRNGHDLAFDTNLLFLNVNSRVISVNTDTTDPARALLVDGKTLTTNLDSTSLYFPNSLAPTFSISSNEIASNAILNLVASSYVNADEIITDKISINNNVISTLGTNQLLSIEPNGTGTVEIISGVNITGNLTTPNDITLDGHITFGSDDQDSISFAADINSNIIPDQTDLYSLGSNPVSGNRWEGLHTELINGQEISALGIVSGDINQVLRQGNVWYVAANGSDANVGDHQEGPFATIGHALTQASAGDEIFIYPGTYQEAFPLTIPVGVSVKGSGIRSVTVTPTAGTNTNNAFVMNGETTLSDLTVKDFYTGYAFSFASNFKVTTRSPYVQNISVITQESSLGAGDAGKGALVDGSVAHPDTKEASMLFHSVTFITPDVDAITMTNGVRVEWLNSFIYYAYRGLYALNGTLGLSSLGTRFGAEIRSIGSANVYGTYGAVADGASTLMYLINHNFAYIGSGTDSTNDASLNVQENETVELNDGKIYYQSVDNKGNFAVGDAFNVSFETGGASINGITTSATGITSINFSDGTSETIVNSQLVSTGKIKFEDNNINSLAGAVNFSSNTGEILLNNNTDIPYNLGIDGNFTIDGILTVGNQFIDVVTFNAPAEFDFRPQSPTYKLGSSDNTWSKVYVVAAQIDDTVSISANTISTITTNTDLELVANGIGQVKTTTSDVEIDQTLDVAGTSTVQDLSITGAVSLLGDYNQTGNYTQTGNRDVSGTLTVTSDVFFDDINFIDNRILTTIGNNDLELLANGTGIVAFNENLRVVNDFTIGNLEANGLENSLTITSDIFTDNTINIDNNTISILTTDTDLELTADGTGQVNVTTTDVVIDQTLSVNSTTYTKDVNVTGDILLVGDYNQTGNYTQTGNRDVSGTLTVTSDVFFDDINFIDNRILTTIGNNNLELLAAGTGIVKFNENLRVVKDFTIGTLTLNGLTNSGTITSDIFTNSDITIVDNSIYTTVGNTNLTLTAAGTGSVYLPTDPVLIDNNLTIADTANLKTTIINGTLDHLGNTTQTGNVLNHTGNFDLTGDLTVTGTNAWFKDVRIVNNQIYTSLTNSDLVLSANGSGIINLNDYANFGVDLTVSGLTSTSTLTSTGTVLSDIFTAGDIEIYDNIITTTLGNNNLILTGNGTGGPKLEKIKFNADTISTDSSNYNIILTTPGKNVLLNTTTSLKVPVGTTINRPTLVQGDVRFNTTDSLYRGYSSAKVAFGGVYSDNLATKILAHPTNNTLNFTNNSTQTASFSSTGLNVNALQVDDLNFNNSTISSTATNTDVTFTPNGSGYVTIGTMGLASNEILNLDLTDPLLLQNTNFGYVKFNGTGGIVIPSGDSASRPLAPQTGDLRWNTDLSEAEVFNGIAYQALSGSGGDVLSAEEVQEVTNLWGLVLG